MEGVREDEARNGPSERVEARVVLGECASHRFALRALGIGVRLFVYREEQVECVEQEVTTAARRVEHAEVTRIFLRAWREFLAGLAYQILAALGKRGVH